MSRILYGITFLSSASAFVLVGCSGSSGGGAAPGSDSGTMADSSKGSDTGPSGDSGAPSDGSADTGSSSDTGTASDTGTDGGSVSCKSGDAGSKAYSGVLQLSHTTLPKSAYSVLGEFYTTPAVSPSTCRGMMMGACCYETSSTATLTPADVGTLTVTDGTKTLVTLMSPTYIAASEEDPTITWKAGDTLKVTASGGTIDAFDVTLGAPAPFAGLTPSFSADVAVDLTKDFVVKWTPGKDECGTVLFGFGQGATDPYIGCTVLDSAGTVTVPKALLGMFTATTGNATLQRLHGADAIATNAVIGAGAFEVVMATATFSH
jgi:hypothetical protein